MERREDEDARHKREEQERRAKRKAQKASKSDAQREKDRRGKEYRQKILKQHASGQQDHAAKRQKMLPDAPESSGVSEFQKLFEQRAQGFQIDFRFRNAPPRPPVGPCFVGQSLDAVLLQHAQHYKALNTVEIHHRWKLHNESDLGVPLAPSAMDVKSYTALPKSVAAPSLHPDDEALLNWKGPMGDTAAEELKLKQDRARAAARATAAGRTVPAPPVSPAVPVPTTTSNSSLVKDKKAFSRVLKEEGAMPTFMKKTTYLSNDYSRKVHDFKSLAQTQQQLAKDLEKKQSEMTRRRSTGAIVKSFEQTGALVHPSKKGLKPKKVYSVLPAVEQWGRPFTHVVIDKKPKLPKGYTQTDLRKGLIANVEKPDQNARMTCQMLVPARQEEENKDYFEVIQSYDLDVIPLKDEDAPHAHFCLVLDPDTLVANYIPISSRIQLSTGRPTKPVLRSVRSRAESLKEKTDREMRVADIDLDMAEKHNIDQDDDHDDDIQVSKPSSNHAGSKNDDGEDDFGDDDDDDDSGDEALFGGANTIVAEN